MSVVAEDLEELYRFRGASNGTRHLVGRREPDRAYCGAPSKWGGGMPLREGVPDDACEACLEIARSREWLS